MNDTLAAKLAHKGFKLEAKLLHVLTEFKCLDQILNLNIHLNIHNSLYF